MPYNKPLNTYSIRILRQDIHNDVPVYNNDEHHEISDTDAIIRAGMIIGLMESDNPQEDNVYHVIVKRIVPAGEFDIESLELDVIDHTYYAQL